MFGLNSTYLRTFVEVGNFGSLSRAAALLKISQPAISRQIRKLEDDLGVSLIIRHGRGVVLTEAGAVVHRHATEILKQVANVRSELAALRTAPSGKVTVGVPFTIGPLLGPALLKTTGERYPGVFLKVVSANSNTLLEWLVSGRIDIAILQLMRPPQNLIVEPLLQEDLYLIGPPDNEVFQSKTVPMRNVMNLPLYLSEAGSELRRFLDAAAQSAGIAYNVVVEMDSIEMMKAMARAGGFSIMPISTVREEIKHGVLAASMIVMPTPQRVMMLATTSFQPLSVATRAVAETMRRTVRDLVSSGEWVATLPR